ncbi:hypothetical protein HDU97_002066 [Phlyctochytrium planicorne]|nr:hypothetical protein HDU97_002066 [Phlyctochytrium planicorne]
MTSGGRRRVIQDPNRSVISLGGENDFPPTPTSHRKLYPATKSFGFADDDVPATPLSHLKKFPETSGGGKASLDLAGGGEVETPKRKVLQPTGGKSEIDLAGEKEVAGDVKVSIRPLQKTGGNSSISLAGEGKAFDGFSIRPLKPTGGESTIDLSGTGVVPGFKHLKVLQPAGGRSQVILGGDGPFPASPTNVHRTPPGGRTSISLGSGETGREQPKSPSFNRAGGRLILPEVLGEEEDEKEDEEEEKEENIDGGVSVVDGSSLAEPLSITTISSAATLTPSKPNLLQHDVAPPTPPSSVPSPLSSPSVSGRGFKNHNVSSVVFGDDGLTDRDVDFSPRRKGVTRRALAEPGGGRSNITFG